MSWAASEIAEKTKDERRNYETATRFFDIEIAKSPGKSGAYA